MRHIKTLVVALGVILWLPMVAQAAEESGAPAEKPAQAAEGAAAPAKCLEAVVNPVTGFAVCMNPRGAPVEQPSRATLNQPCKAREHDKDPFTVYEHWSDCQ